MFSSRKFHAKDFTLSRDGIAWKKNDFAVIVRRGWRKKLFARYLIFYETQQKPKDGESVYSAHRSITQLPDKNCQSINQPPSISRQRAIKGRRGGDFPSLSFRLFFHPHTHSHSRQHDTINRLIFQCSSKSHPILAPVGTGSSFTFYFIFKTN